MKWVVVITPFDPEVAREVFGPFDSLIECHSSAKKLIEETSYVIGDLDYVALRKER